MHSVTRVIALRRLTALYVTRLTLSSFSVMMTR